MKKDTISNIEQITGVEIPEKQIEIFARRLLPEIKRFLSDEKMQSEFEEWQRKQGKAK